MLPPAERAESPVLEDRTRPVGRVLTWSATLLGPLVLWAGGFWLAGFSQASTYPDGTTGAFTPRDSVWFVGLVIGVPAVPVATVVGVVITAVAAPRRRVAVTRVVLGIDAVAVAIAVLWAILAGPS